MINSTSVKNYSGQSIQNIYQLPFEITKVSPLRSQTYSRPGNWSNYQKIKFCIFIQYHLKSLEKIKKRRSLKTFKYMAEFLKTKNPKQCRSHHQKIGKMYQNILLFVQQIKSIQGIERYSLYENLYSEQLKNLHYEMVKLFKLTEQKQESIEIQKVEKAEKAEDRINRKNIKQCDEKLPPTGLFYKEYKDQDLKEVLARQENKMLQIQKAIDIDIVQKQQVLQECNYYFGNWIKSVLKLQELNHTIWNRQLSKQYYFYQ